MLERDDQADLLLVALRVLPELPARVEVEALDELCLVGRVDAAAEVREVLDRLAAGQLVVERELAGQVADAAVDRDRVGGRLDAEDERPAGRRADVVEQGPDRRRLAGAVRPEEPEGLALGHLEIDVDDPAVRAVGLRELLCLDDRGHDDPFPPVATGTAPPATVGAGPCPFAAARSLKNRSIVLGSSCSMNAMTSRNSSSRARALADSPAAATPRSAISRSWR